MGKHYLRASYRSDRSTLIPRQPFFLDIPPPNWSLALEKSIPWSLTSDTEDDDETGHLIQLDIVHPSAAGSEEDQTTTMSGRTRVEFLISRSGVLRLPDPPDRTPAQELHWQMLPHTTIPVSSLNHLTTNVLCYQVATWELKVLLLGLILGIG